MCGIIGIVGDIKQVAPSTTDAMLASLARRGPDDHGSMGFPGAILGQTRLSIIDLSSGHQPMKDNARNIAITFNGEIYNYRKLKDTLQTRGHTFSTNSDTEVILKAYIEYGTECPKHLDGMFAFALWDEEKRRLFVARDRFGKKSFYYAHDADGNLIFASEIKAILASGVRGTIDKRAIDNYLELMYIPPWKSVYENIHQLPPAHSAVYEHGNLNITRYWTLPHRPITINYEDAKEETKRLLDEAVKKRMLAADVEVGSLLSGGVDSTIVSILASRHLDHPLKTFSLGYGEYANELPWAQQASDAMHSEHYTLTAGADMTAELEKVTAYFDEPHADSSDFPQHILSELASTKVKVALSGDGGDELFMGYGWHTRHHHLSYRHNPIEKLFPDPFAGRVRYTRVFSPIQRLLLWGSPFPINSDIYADGAYAPGLDAMEKITIFDFTTYLPGQLLAKLDRTSMMHGLEMRSPFLDQALVEFVTNLPLEYKSNPREYKILLKDILTEYMPRDFVYRRKMGFGAPTGKWLREDRMSAYAREKLGNDARIKNLLSPHAVEHLCKRYFVDRDDRLSLQVWTLLCLELWLRSLERPTTL
jgi:asparagine synthase (glutamine-hydrolysing)